MIRKKHAIAVVALPIVAVSLAASSAQAQRTRRPRPTTTTAPAPTTSPEPSTAAPATTATAATTSTAATTATAAPTTAAPATTSTAAPTTAAPATTSTAAPTTAAPTTAAPTAAAVSAPNTAPPLPAFNDPNVFYVSPSGKNENPGTRAKPWLTPSKAAQTLTAGQTALFDSGTYTEGLYIQTSGTSGKPITFKAAPGATPMIKLSDKNAGGVYVAGASYIRVEGFDLSYIGPPGPFGPDNGYGDGMTAGANDAKVKSHHVQFVNNKVRNFPGGGINGLQADYLLIEGNTVSGNSFWSPYDTSGISLYQTANHDFAGGVHNIIRGNTVFGNENRVPDRFINEITDGNCIIIDDQRRYQNKLSNKTADGPYQSQTLVENNICAGNGGRGVHVFNSDNVMVRNNTMYSNMRTLKSFGGEMSAVFSIEPTDRAIVIPNRGNVRFVNNIAVSDGSKLTATFADSPADEKSFRFDHNFYFGEDPDAAGETDIIGNANPFVAPNTNAAIANFRLNSEAWALDRATPDQAPPVDIGGTKRPQGGVADMGAWEYIYG
jgi:parallel beta-helix repeat protein